MPNNKHGHHWIRDEKRHKIYSRDNYRCVWCGIDLSTPADPHDRTLDHIIPREEGGGNNASNLVTACLDCNTQRGSTSAVGFAFNVADMTGEPAYRVLNRLILAIATEIK